MFWGVGVFFASELTYGLCFHFVRKAESQARRLIKTL